MRCLKHNKSCSRALELLGAIAEREAAYTDAVSNYEAAWKIGGKVDASLGYKLGFNLLKVGLLGTVLTANAYRDSTRVVSQSAWHLHPPASDCERGALHV